MEGRQLISRSIYPVTIGLGIVIFLTLLQTQNNLLLSTYIPVILGAVIITFSELLLPYRREWLPKKFDIKNDLIFMVTVQMVLPKILTFTVVVGIFKLLAYFDLSFFNFWPNYLPLWLQTVIMILVADFLRYWLHVLAHNYEPVWKLHAVHHSPDKLYWLNVGRFHPIEKGIQFLFDALPFILLGVSKEVMGMYFVFYAINGFFQHCNIDLKMGILNYIISGPELHRWHHSRKVNESNNNYGNNVIIWDLIFGTYYFPSKESVDELGLVNQNYPQDYGHQMMTPFSGKIDKKNIPPQHLKGMVINYFLDRKMKGIKKKLLDPINVLAEHPQKAQEETLQRIIDANIHTEFGQKYQFESIKNYESFRSNVPVHEYEGLRAYIERQDQTKEPILTSENPFMFSQTSGTTGTPKYIPVSKSSLEELKETQQIFAAVQYEYAPEGYMGKMLGLVGAAEEGILETGTPYGSASSAIAKTMPKSARVKYVAPYQVFDIEDYRIKYYVIARLGVGEKNVSFLASANPSTFHQLYKIINDEWDTILKDVEQGTCAYMDKVAPDIKKEILRICKPNPKRAKKLAQLRVKTDAVDFKDIWPYLRVVTTWTGGSCGISLDSILHTFPEDIKVVEIGYLSSEVRGTITVDPENNEGIPTLHQNFFEFVLKENWENDIHKYEMLHQLKQGKEYYVFVTTSTGLYRYNMNDIIMVSGKYRNTPTIKFIQKGKGFTNITGEKLYEGQLLSSMQKIEEEFELGIRFYIVLANQKESTYELFYETANQETTTIDFAQKFDDHLRAINLEYDAKRSSNRLHCIRCSRLKDGTFEAYKRHFLAKGVRESQFKIILLQYAEELDFKIQDHVDR